MGLVQRLADIDLSDWNGESRRLGAFWGERAVVLVFIRHFG
jgi:hypothetical protein